MRNKILELVDKICSMDSMNCRSLNKSEEARKLMDIANIPADAIISEIPLDWDRQVVILFCVPNNNHYYELFAGIGLDGKFYFELSEIGTIIESETHRYFDFYQEHGMENIVLPINYFKA